MNSMTERVRLAVQNKDRNLQDTITTNDIRKCKEYEEQIDIMDILGVHPVHARTIWEKLGVDEI